MAETSDFEIHDDTSGPPPLSRRFLPEITVKAVILGALLSMVLAAANAYLGLLAGMTVSASIPAAVISMAVLRMFRRSNILENNIVQTAASAGESLAAGVVFTFPAMVLLGAWTEFHYWQTTLIAALGGILGVLFTVPLRRALIIEAKLRYPEGVATAEVLEVGQKGSGGIGCILAGAGLGALYKLGASGLKLWHGTIELARSVGGSIAYFGMELGPALVAVGYIVGINIAVLVFIGGAMNWYVAIPIMSAGHSSFVVDGEVVSAAKFAWHLWDTQTRYIGVGAMIVGGLWAVVRLFPSLIRGVRSGLEAHRTTLADGAGPVDRAERDVPMRWIGIALILSVVPLFFLFHYVTGSVAVAAVMAAVMLVGGFLFSAVASYMAGVVGSSNNPISGVTIATILSAALLLSAMLGSGSVIGPAAAILIGAVVCCAAAIGGDNMQDLKTGQLVGATPWKQQVMQAVGVLAAAFVMAPVLSALLTAYGIGPKTLANPDSLKAPQATLMKSIAEGVFKGGLPWTMIWIGMGVAVVVIVLDLILARRGSKFRTPVLAVAVGIYLPMELGISILAGGLVSLAVARLRRPVPGGKRSPTDTPSAGGKGRGVLFAAGLITGEALLGIMLAFPIAVSGNKRILALPLPGGPIHWIGAIFTIAALVGLYRVSMRRKSA